MKSKRKNVLNFSLLCASAMTMSGCIGAFDNQPARYVFDIGERRRPALNPQSAPTQPSQVQAAHAHNNMRTPEGNFANPATTIATNTNSIPENIERFEPSPLYYYQQRNIDAVTNQPISAPAQVVYEKEQPNTVAQVEPASTIEVSKVNHTYPTVSSVPETGDAIQQQYQTARQKSSAFIEAYQPDERLGNAQYLPEPKRTPAPKHVVKAPLNNSQPINAQYLPEQASQEAVITAAPAPVEIAQISQNVDMKLKSSLESVNVPAIDLPDVIETRQEENNDDTLSIPLSSLQETTLQAQLGGVQSPGLSWNYGSNEGGQSIIAEIDSNEDNISAKPQDTVSIPTSDSQTSLTAQTQQPVAAIPASSVAQPTQINQDSFENNASQSSAFAPETEEAAPFIENTYYDPASNTVTVPVAAPIASVPDVSNISHTSSNSIQLRRPTPLYERSGIIPPSRYTDMRRRNARR